MNAFINDSTKTAESFKDSNHFAESSSDSTNNTNPVFASEMKQTKNNADSTESSRIHNDSTAFKDSSDSNRISKDSTKTAESFNDSTKPTQIQNNTRISTDSTTLTITKAQIKESLDSLFNIELDCIDLSPHTTNATITIYPSNANASNTSNANAFNTNHYLDSFAIINLPNPNNTLDSINFNNKHYKGIISNITHLGLKQVSDKLLHHFRITITSILFRLSLNKANRIFLNKNIIEVIKDIFNFHSINKTLDFNNIHFNYESKEIISQYQESDLDFIKRLAYNNGIYFYEDNENIYFYDFKSSSNVKSLNFNHSLNNALNEPCVFNLYKTQSIMPNSFLFSSHNASNLVESAMLYSQLPCYNNHSYISKFSFNQQLDLKESVNLAKKRLDTINNTMSAESNIFDLSLNELVKINNTSFLITHINQSIIYLNKHKKQNLSHIADDKNNLESLNTTTSLTLLKSPFNFAPPFLPKPKAPNSTLGIVVGDSVESQSNTIHTDKFNRVRVRINCFYAQSVIDAVIINEMKQTKNNADSIESSRIQSDSNNSKQNATNAVIARQAEGLAWQSKKRQKSSLRENPQGFSWQSIKNTDSIDSIESKSDSTAFKDSSDSNKISDSTQDSTQNTYSYLSPFLRVASQMASNHSGLFHIPRVGDEVIVSFLDDDIDKPYISASLYNQSNPSLINSPKDFHKTSLSSKTIGESEKGINEITLSNLKDKEQIYIKAQKDYVESINHNFSQNIKNNKDANIQGSYTEHIQKTHTQTINLAKSVNIGGEYLTSVALSKDTIVGGSHTLNIGASNKIRVANDSEENIGGDKREEIGGKLNTSIEQDENRNIKGNKKELVEGNFELDSIKGLNYRSQEHINLQAINYIDIFAKESFSIQTDKQHTEIADSKYSEIQTNYSVNAGNQITHQVGDTTITTKGDSVIIKAGGVEVVIDSNGLIVKGGEIKAE